MSYTKKINNFEDALETMDLSQVFYVSHETLDSIAFQAVQTIGNGTGSCVITIYVTDYLSNTVYYLLGTLNDTSNKNDMLELFNNWNFDGDPLLKFTISPDNEVLVKLTYLANEDTFNGEWYLTLAKHGFTTIKNDYYNEIMKVLWA